MSRKKFLAIVDPWASPSPHDAEKYPMLESDSNIQCQLIHNQLSRLKPLFDDIIVLDTGYPSHPLFDELPSYGFEYEKGEYLSDKQDWDMWLCGFHYGRCVQGKIVDVVERYKWDYNRFHIIENLSFMFPEDKKRLWGKKDWCIDITKNVKVYNWDYVSRFELLVSASIFLASTLNEK